MPGLEAGGAVLGDDVGRRREDREVGAPAAERPDLLRGGEPVEDGHVDVHEHDVEGLARAHGSAAWRPSLAMVIEQPDFCRNERAVIHRVVLGDEDLESMLAQLGLELLLGVSSGAVTRPLRLFDDGAQDVEAQEGAARGSPVRWRSSLHPLDEALRDGEPSPVPPNSREVDRSAWMKGSKSRSARSGWMPMPVSSTSNRRRLRRSWEDLSMRRVTAPSVVNLMALLTRFEST